MIPVALRRRFGIEEGTLVVAEPRDGGVLIRPAVVLPVDVYTAKAQGPVPFSNAVGAADYANAVLHSSVPWAWTPMPSPTTDPPGCEAWTGCSSTPMSSFTQAWRGEAGLQRLWELDDADFSVELRD